MLTGAPPALNNTVPKVGSPVTVTESVSPSRSIGSLSPKGLLVEASSTVIVLSVATGGSCSGVTLTVIVLGVVWNSAPSLTEKSNVVYPLPNSSGSGTKDSLPAVISAKDTICPGITGVP